MEGNIINGRELGEFEAISISLGQAKKENRDGKKSKFAVFTYQSTYSGRVDPVRDIIFEDSLGDTTWEVLMKFRKTGDNDKPKVDSKGGYVVDVDAIRDAADAGDRAAKRVVRLYLDVPGGMIVPFQLQGERYANDVNGQPVLNKAGQRVKKQMIRVFVQVQNIIPGPDGKPVTQYVGGISPEVRGLELQERFYREVVQKAVAPTETPTDTDNKTDEDPF